MLKGVKIRITGFIAIISCLFVNGIVFTQCKTGNCENGNGVSLQKDGSVFTGQFQNGNKIIGKVTYPSGSIYEGNFLNNLRHGYGIFRYSNGDSFQGEYSEDKKVYGLYSHKSGNAYFGYFENNKPDGFGSYTKKDGSVYEGFWNEGTPSFRLNIDSLEIDTSKSEDLQTERGLAKGSKSIRPKIYAVVVGVSDYYSINDLSYCDDDARVFYNHLKSAFPSETSQGEVSILTDKNATHENILSELKRVFSKASENDFIMFFFSGHGGKGLLCPTDDYNNLYYSEIKSIFKSSSAKYRLCIADACYSGGLSNSSSTPSYSDLEKLKDARLAVILSSTSEQTSSEMSSLRQGLFTYYLMKGLRGNGDLNGDRYVTAGELFMYTREAVRRKSNGKQIPVIIGQQLHRIPLCKLK
jgi:hypothetical protein